VCATDSPFQRLLKNVFACPIAFGAQVFASCVMLMHDLLGIGSESIRSRLEASGVLHAALGCVLHRSVPLVSDLEPLRKIVGSIRTVHGCVLARWSSPSPLVLRRVEV
jgi:hypothetical protein